jgi:hypothetical protein
MIGMLLAEMLELMGHEVCALERTEAHAVAAAIQCKRSKEYVPLLPVPHLFASGAWALRPDAVMIQKPFREATSQGGIQRALDAATTS